MLISLDWLAAHVTHRSAARARHLIAALGLVEALLAARTLAQHRLAHAVLDECAHARLARALHFLAAQRNVTRLPTQPDTNKSRTR